MLLNFMTLTTEIARLETTLVPPGKDEVTTSLKNKNFQPTENLSHTSVKFILQIKMLHW